MNYNYAIKYLEFEGKKDFLYFAFEEETGILTNFFTGEVVNFANEGEPSEITVETSELKRLIDEWVAARDKFKEQKTKGEI